MGDTEKGNIDLLRRLQAPSPFGFSQSSSSSHQNHDLDVTQLNLAQFRGPARQNLPSFGSEIGRRVSAISPSYPQMPPISPYSQMGMNKPVGQQIGVQSLGHSRSLSQPPIFNFDSLPPLGPSAYKDGMGSVSGEHQENHDGGSSSGNSALPPPRKLHRRSVSDVPFGVNDGFFGGGGGAGGGGLQRTLSGGSGSAQSVKKEEKPDGEAMDELLAAYMNLDGNDLLNSDEKSEGMNREDSNSKAHGGENSDNDTESSANESGCSGQGLKRNVGGDPVHTGRHQRSISMDSFMGKLQLSDDSPNLQVSAAGALAGQGYGGESSRAFNLGLNHGEFNAVELKKIMANDKLAEIAVTDPKRVKRILANRQSAARSKERKMRYISELEHKVQTLQNEATTLSAQLTILQKDSEGLTNLNHELKFRLQALEQQAQLRDALNDTLTKEIHRLRIANGEIPDPRTRATEPFGFMNQQMLHQLAPKRPDPPKPSSSKTESNSSC